MRNSAKNFLHSGVLALSMLPAIPAIGEVTALDRYVAAPDPSYRYELIETIPGDGYAAHVLEMTSQRWRDETEVDRPLWKHWLTVIEPEQVATGTALLIVGGGSNERKPPARANLLLAMGAVATRSVIAELRMVPNQPLTFVGETQQRSEDAIIAYSWDKYLRTGDESWPLRLPMTKSVVRPWIRSRPSAAALRGAGSMSTGLWSEVPRSEAGQRGPRQLSISAWSPSLRS